MNASIPRERLLARLRHCLGEPVLSALMASDVIELVLNPDGQVFIEHLGGAFEPIGTMSAGSAETLIGLVAHAGGYVVDRNRPIVSGLLPLGGWRFEGLLPPVVSRPCFAIRKPATGSLRLADYLVSGAMSEQDACCLRAAIAQRKNIVVAGGTSSGKTTLADALLAEVAATCPDHRLLILEDTAELRTSAINQVALQTSAEVDMGQLLKSALRLRPDRIIVGEVRDGAALTLLKAWNTGHAGGITTVHANSAPAALLRLEQLVAEVSSGPMSAVIAEAVDLVVAVQRTPVGRRVSEIVRVLGTGPSGYLLAPNHIAKESMNAA